MLYDDLYADIASVLLEDTGISIAVDGQRVPDLVQMCINELLRDCLKVYDIASMTVSAGSATVQISPGAIIVEEVFWEGLRLEKTYPHSIEFSSDASSVSGRPEFWCHDLSRSGSVRLYPVPDSPGQMKAIYVVRSSDVSDIGFGKQIPYLPDSVASLLRWGVLAKIFSQDGEGKDMRRARYCQYRWDEAKQIIMDVMGGRV